MSIIVKPAPDTDFYVEWSTVADGPAFTGTKAEMIEYLMFGDTTLDDVLERLERVDETGSSAKSGAYGYTDSGFVVGRGVCGSDGGWLPRERLGEWVRTPSDSLLEPFDS